MTRFRKTVGTTGRVVFVGAGPGDPGMLTARATAAIAEAAPVLVDGDVPTAVQDAVHGINPAAEIVPVSGEPAEIAKSAVAAASRGPVSEPRTPSLPSIAVTDARRNSSGPCSPSAISA